VASVFGDQHLVHLGYGPSWVQGPINKILNLIKSFIYKICIFPLN
jgi:hypothetical protein